VSTEHAIDYAAFVEDGAVSQRLFTDPEIFRQELQRIWYGGWVYVGHESEIPNPGDHVTRVIGAQPVVMSRDGSGRPSVARMPRVDAYRGFVFGSFAESGPSLAEHLGRAADYLDRYCDRAPTGRLAVSTRAVSTRYDANWKLVLDNAVDGYHPMFLHRAVFKSYGAEAGSRLATSYADDGDVTMRDLGGGHAILDTRGPNRAGGLLDFSEGDITRKREEYIAAVGGLVGPERARELVLDGMSNVVIFPNLMLIYQDVRVIQPISPVRSVVHNRVALLGGGPDWVNETRLRQQNASYGPAGMVTPDDMEVFERSQRAFATQKPDRLLFTRGAWRDERLDDGSLQGRATDETAHRGIWRHYRAVMAA
jgi:phenylpropionate dioxygenase-like ring-hydroxylating dioxygenase large terminal subunit